MFCLVAQKALIFNDYNQFIENLITSVY